MKHPQHARKPAGSAGAAEIGTHSVLMRQMGSRDGAWNPEPDDQILGTLRDDVYLSPNETKFLAYVKCCCTRQKQGGRSAWGKTDSGEPLILQRIADRFDWDRSNAAKYAKRLLEWGFVRVKNGVFGLGADVTGKAEDDGFIDAAEDVENDSEEGVDKEGEQKEKDLNHVVCTHHMPQYLLVDIKRLTPKKRDLFLTEWSHLDQLAKRRLADAAEAVRRQEFKEKNDLCQRFGTKLQEGKKPERKEPPTVQLSFFSGEDFHRSVQTTSENGSVQTQNGGLYEPENKYVQTDASLLGSEVSQSSELASADAVENQALEEAALEAIQRSRLEILGGKKLDGRTVRTIRSHLQRLPDEEQVKEVLDVLEDKCRYLAKRPAEASEKTWGWIVGVVKGEVQNHVDKAPSTAELHDQLRWAAKAKGIS